MPTEQMDLSPDRIEYAYGLCMRAQMCRWQEFADTGYRAALDKNPNLLKALEKGAEEVGRLSEEQTGQTRRQASRGYKDTKEHTEAQLWREAYRLADEGRPIRNLEWIYGAAAWLAGLVPMSSRPVSMQ